jgi:predicted acetyltransferase
MTGTPVRDRSPGYRIGTPEDHRPANALIALAFGKPEATQRFVDRSAPEDMRVVADDDGELVAALHTGRLGQWWLGRRVPSAQVLRLATSPHHGGRGYATALLTGFLSELHDAEVPTATLFASTAALYRGAGFEAAGDWTEYRIRADRLPRTTAPWRARQVGLDDLDDARALYDQVAATRHGALDRDEQWWRQHLLGASPDTVAQFILEGPLPGGDDEGPVGWALVSYGTEDHWKARLWVKDWGCLPGAERGLYGLLGGYGVLDGVVEWTGPDPDPAVLALPERHFELATRDPWYLRVVDLKLALASRPYPEALRGTVRMRVNDPRCPWNTGTWLLEVADGKGTVEPVSSATTRTTMRIEPRGLGGLFTGYLDPDDLARGGLLSDGSPRELSLLRAAFCSRRPWVAEHY